ncbi:MAG: efflux transporter outer membrane subunit [Acidobacteriaceae bacterium]|nr:efflux transporter outer membrane subunit [Acidobacteriaceae bacterium]
MTLTDKSGVQRSWPAIALFSLMALAACNPAPKYSRPPAPIPTAYKEAPPQFKEGTGWVIAQPGDDKLRPKWWEMYKDPQLNALEEQVVISNQTVKQAEANFRAARGLVVTARSALFPTIGGSAGYTRSHPSANARNIVIGTSGPSSTNTSGATTASVGSGSFNSYTIAADISYTVDFWHRIRNTIAANSYAAQASAADVATATLSTHAELAQDYFEIRALDAQEGILQDTLKNYRDSLNLTLTLFSAGIDSEQDVTQATTQLDTTKAQATDLGVARAQFEHAIATLIGKPASEFSLPVAPFVPRPPTVPVSLPSELLERRPDIAAAERQIASANAQIGVARAAYYPSVSLSASGGFQSAAVANWFTWPSRLWSIGPSLSQTLLDFGARRGAVEQSEATYDAAVASYRQTVLSDFQAVEDNLASIRILAEEISEYDTAVQSSGRYLELALTRFRTGVDSYLNVITAQNTLLANRETQVQAQLRQMTASVTLIMALGGGWDSSQFPTYDQLLEKPAKWSPNGPALPKAENAPAPPNPPAIPPVSLPPQTPNGAAADSHTKNPLDKDD